MEFRLPRTKERVRREAADWLVRLQDNRDPEMGRRFRHWYNADARHAGAFDRVQRTYEQAGLLRLSPTVIRYCAQPLVRASTTRRRAAFAAVAVLAVLVPVGVGLWRADVSPIERIEAVMLTTQVGQITEVRLSDGSKVTLDTATRLYVEIGPAGRRAHLKYGRVRFQIATGRMPFVVQTTAATVSARQAVLDVEQTGPQGQIQVLKGMADVHKFGAGQDLAVPLAAGQALTFGPKGGLQKRAVDRIPEWTRGMLEFDESALPDAVALANRYSERHIVLGGDVDGLRVTGAFRAGDTVRFAHALEAAFGLSLSRRPDGNLLLSSRQAATRSK